MNHINYIHLKAKVGVSVACMVFLITHEPELCTYASDRISFSLYCMSLSKPHAMGVVTIARKQWGAH